MGLPESSEYRQMGNKWGSLLRWTGNHHTCSDYPGTKYKYNTWKNVKEEIKKYKYNTWQNVKKDIQNANTTHEKMWKKRYKMQKIEKLKMQDANTKYARLINLKKKGSQFPF